MELVFCSLCHQSVPLADLTTGKARRAGERVACAACLGVLEAPKTAASDGQTAQALERTRRRSTLLLSTVLASTALLTTVVVAGLLLLRLEAEAEDSERERAALSAKLDQLEKRSFGLERFAARLVQEQVDALRADVREVARVPDERLREAALAELDSARQSFVHELEQALQQNGNAPASDSPVPAPTVLSDDVDERLAWLEDQLSDLRLRRDLPPEASVDTGLPRLPYPGSDDPLRAEVLVGLTHENPARRAGALFAIAAEGNRAAVRDVLPLLQDKHPYVRETAARLLERLDARVAVQSLIAALDDEHADVREAAVTALRGITGKAFGYDPRADNVERARAVAAWKAWWRDAWKGFLYGEGAVEGE